MKIFPIEEEFRKNPQLKREYIAHLRRWIDEEKYVPTSISDLQIAVFLHCCHYNVDATKDLMKINYKWRAENSNFCTNRNPKLSPKLEIMTHNVVFLILPQRSNANELIMFVQCIDNTPKNFHLMETVKLFIMFVDLYLIHQGSSNGVVFIIDSTALTFALSRRLEISSLRALITYLQEGIPINVNAIHFMNSHAIIDLVFAMVRPFIKSDLVNKIHFHRAGSSSIFSHLDSTYIPKLFGGDEETPINQLHEQSLELLQSFEPWFKEDENAFKNYVLMRNQGMS